MEYSLTVKRLQSIIGGSVVLQEVESEIKNASEIMCRSVPRRDFCKNGENKFNFNL